MVEPIPTPNPMMVAYHVRSDHGRDGAELDSFTCNCRAIFIDYTMMIAAVTIEELCVNLNDNAQMVVDALGDEPGDWNLGYVQGVLDTRDVLLQLVKDLTS